MKEMSTVGLDLAENAFQGHAVDAAGAVAIRRQVGWSRMRLFFLRLPPCVMGMQACAGRIIGRES